MSEPNEQDKALIHALVPDLWPDITDEALSVVAAYRERILAEERGRIAHVLIDDWGWTREGTDRLFVSVRKNSHECAEVKP